MSLPEQLSQALRDRYPLIRLVASGGMAQVYLAHDLRHKRDVVVKVLRSEFSTAVTAERFVREIETLARLQHPHILPLLDSGEAAGQRWFVTPWIVTGTLADRLAREGRLPVSDAVSIASQVTEALQAAHDQGVVHRDVKPSNILLGPGGVLLADFGISSLADATAERLTATGVSVGTPSYMSPEQASGGSRVGPRADLYALGCVLFEMLGGQPPFPGPDARTIMARHVLDPVPSLAALRPGVSAELDAVVQRALAKDPSDRWPDATALRRALAGPFDATPASSARYRPRGRRPQQWLALLGVLFTILAGGWLIAGVPVAETPIAERRLTSRGDVADGVISPDGQFVIFRTRDSLWLLDVATGEAMSRLALSRNSQIGGWDSAGTGILINDRERRQVVVLPRVGGAPRVVAEARPGPREFVLSDGIGLLRPFHEGAEPASARHLGLLHQPSIGQPGRVDTIRWKSPVPDSVIGTQYWAVSRDGRHLAVLVGLPGRNQLVVYDRNADSFAFVPADDPAIGKLSWRADSRVFYARTGDSVQVFRRRADRWEPHTKLFAARNEWSASRDARRVVLWREWPAPDVLERAMQDDTVAAIGRGLPLGSLPHKLITAMASDGQLFVALASNRDRTSGMPYSVPVLYDLASDRLRVAPIDSARYYLARFGASGASLLLSVESDRTLNRFRMLRLDLETGVTRALGTVELFDQVVELADGRVLRLTADPSRGPRARVLLELVGADTVGTVVASLDQPAYGVMLPSPMGSMLGFGSTSESGPDGMRAFDLGSGRVYRTPPRGGLRDDAQVVAWEGDSVLWFTRNYGETPNRRELWRWRVGTPREILVLRQLPASCRLVSVPRRTVICPPARSSDLWLLESDRPILP